MRLYVILTSFFGIPFLTYRTFYGQNKFELFYLLSINGIYVISINSSKS